VLLPQGPGPDNELLAEHQRASIELRREHMVCLKETEWLNDEVINMYVAMLQVRHARKAGGGSLRVLAALLFSSGLCILGHSKLCRALGTHSVLEAAAGLCRQLRWCCRILTLINLACVAADS
jgi:hypothetical protein